MTEPLTIAPLIERLFAIVAEVAARHALAARTQIRLHLCHSPDRAPSHARVVFGDQPGHVELDIAPAGGTPDLDTYRQLVEAEIERFRWRNRRPAA